MRLRFYNTSNKSIGKFIKEISAKHVDYTIKSVKVVKWGYDWRKVKVKEVNIPKIRLNNKILKIYRKYNGGRYE